MERVMISVAGVPVEALRCGDCTAAIYPESAIDAHMARHAATQGQPSAWGFSGATERQDQARRSAHRKKRYKAAPGS